MPPLRPRSIRTDLIRTGSPIQSVWFPSDQYKLEPDWPNQQTCLHEGLIFGSWTGLAQTVIRLAVNLDLESDCHIRWFLWLELFLDCGNCTAINSRRSFRVYKLKQPRSLNYFEIRANRTGSSYTLQSHEMKSHETHNTLNKC